MTFYCNVTTTVLMIATIVPALIVQASGPAYEPETLRSGNETEVYFCGFEERSDLNYDNWPDGWTRRVGEDYPHYVAIEIVGSEPADDNADGDESNQHQLQISLNGGRASLFSPPIRISSNYSYELVGQIKSRPSPANEQNEAWYTLTFFRADGSVIDEHESSRFLRAKQWQTANIGPLDPPAEDAHHVIVGMHVRPTRPVDLRGDTYFDNIRLARLPKMKLSTNRRFNVFADHDEIQITCDVSGIQDHQATLNFELVDVFDNVVTSKTNQSLFNKFDLAAAQKRTPPVPERIWYERQARQRNRDNEENVGFAGQMSWSPSDLPRGFYRVRVTLHAFAEQMEQELAFAVVAPQNYKHSGHFGWSLPRLESNISLKSLSEMLGQVGIHLLKYPVWYSKDDQESVDRTAELAERITKFGMEMVGVIDVPPNQASDAAPIVNVGIASTMREPEYWQPQLEHIFTRLSLKIQRWQIGADDDNSFVGYPAVENKFFEIKNHMQRFAQDIRLAIKWHWMQEPPRGEGLPWDYVMLTLNSNSSREGEINTLLDPPMSRNEVTNYLGYMRSYLGNSTQAWTRIQPLSNRYYNLETRVRDLVGRMMAAKIERVDGAFVTKPFDDEFGLMTEGGNPTELLVPWRTTANLLAGAEFIGSLRFPNGTPNYVFSREREDGQREAVIVVWNDADDTIHEEMFLGNEVTETSIWGVETPLQTVASSDGQRYQQSFSVDRWPKFLTNANDEIARWRISFRFDKSTIASVFGKRQPVQFSFENPHTRGIGGTIVLNNSELWPKGFQMPFKASANQQFQQPFDIVLRSDANTGIQPVRVDFNIDESNKFSVYRDIQVGHGKVAIELRTEIVKMLIRNSDGELVPRLDLHVHQTMTNNSDDLVSFNCLLYIPQARRQRTQILDMPRGRQTSTYVIPNGVRLVGKELWLQAKEIRGERWLNYRFMVDTSDGDDASASQH